MKLYDRQCARKTKQTQCFAVRQYEFHTCYIVCWLFGYLFIWGVFPLYPLLFDFQIFGSCAPNTVTFHPPKSQVIEMSEGETKERRKEENDNISIQMVNGYNWLIVVSVPKTLYLLVAYTYYRLYPSHTIYSIQTSYKRVFAHFGYIKNRFGGSKSCVFILFSMFKHAVAWLECRCRFFRF